MERLEINSVVVHKPGGGLMEILSSAVVDRPVDEVREAHAYDEAREKAVHVPALKPGDVLEYRVTTTIVKPAAPNQFWFAHDFSRELPAGEESLEIDVPREREIHLQVRSALTLLESKDEVENRVVHRWKTSQERAPEAKEAPPKKTSESTASPPPHDIQLTTFSSWEEVARWLSSSQPASTVETSVAAKADELTREKKEDLQKLEALYSFVATRIRTVPVPLGAVGWKPLPAEQVLKQGYGTATDKHALLAALAKRIGLSAEPVFLGS